MLNQLIKNILMKTKLEQQIKSKINRSNVRSTNRMLYQNRSKLDQQIKSQINRLKGSTRLKWKVFSLEILILLILTNVPRTNMWLVQCGQRNVVSAMWLMQCGQSLQCNVVIAMRLVHCGQCNVVNAMWLVKCSQCNMVSVMWMWWCDELPICPLWK